MRDGRMPLLVILMMTFGAMGPALMVGTGHDDGERAAEDVAPGGSPAPQGTRAAGDWTMFRADWNRTGNLTTTPPGTNEQIWKRSIGYNAYSSAAIVGDYVYVGSTSGFHRLYLSNGTTDWTATSFTGIYTSSPAVVNGYVYVGADDNKLHCFNAGTGAESWAYTTGGKIESSPVVVGSNIYVASNDHKLYSITTSGSLNWASNSLSSSDLCSSPAYNNGYLYIGSAHDYGGDEEVYCIDASNGVIEWTHTLDHEVVCTPAVGYGNVYVTDYNGKAYCLDAAGNGDGTTDVIWTHAGTAHTGSWSCASGALANGYYIYATGGMGGPKSTVYSVDAYGDGLGGTTERWTFNKTGSYGWQASVAVAGGKVLVAFAQQSSNAYLYCLDEATGTENWNYQGGSSAWGLNSGPAISNGRCVFGDSGGDLYCIGGQVIPPVVESVAPTDGSVGVALDTTISATFDVPMLATSLGIGTFLVEDFAGGPVTGTVSYSTGTNTATFTPFDDLAEGETYTVTLLGSVASSTGAGLDGDEDGVPEGSPEDDYSWSFTTVELNAPALSAIPVQEPVEETDHALDLGDYVSDEDTPRAELILTHNSGHCTDEDGFLLTFNYPEGVLEEYVNVSVTDGVKETWQTVHFQVTPVNDAPELALIPPQSGEEDISGQVNITPFITDIDTPVDADHFTLVENSDYIEADGLFLNFLYPEGVLYDTFDLTVIDGGLYPTDTEQTVSGAMTINVQPVNDGPYLRDPGPQTTDEDAGFSLTFEVIDPDDEEFEFDIEAADFGALLPDSLEMDDETMTLTMLPTNDDVGLWNLTVIVDDTHGETDMVNMSIRVMNVNDAPPAAPFQHYIVDAWPETMVLAENLTVTFICEEVVDIDGDELVYRWDFDAADGAQDDIVGTQVVHTYPFAGTFEVTLTVDDRNGGTATTTKAVSVHAVPEPEVPDDEPEQPGDGDDPADGGEPTDGEDVVPDTNTGDKSVEKAPYNAGLILGIVAAVIAAVVALLLVLMMMKRKPKEPEGQDAAAAPMGAPLPGALMAPGAPMPPAASVQYGTPPPAYGTPPSAAYGPDTGFTPPAPAAASPPPGAVPAVPQAAPMAGPPGAPLAGAPMAAQAQGLPYQDVELLPPAQ